jgi:hypothetical protein
MMNKSGTDCPVPPLFQLPPAAHQMNTLFRFPVGQQKILHGERVDFRRLPVEDGGDIGP